MTSPRTAGACLLISFMATGCGAAEGTSAEVVRDSAGVRIVESRADRPGAAPAWRVDEAPVMEIGVAEGAPEYQLAGVRGAVRLAGGGVVVANGLSHELRYYDARGLFVRAAGKEGGGPGEFRSLGGVVAYRGDSVAVWDTGEWRLSVFGPDGGFGRAATVRGPGSMVARLRAAFPDGSFLLAAAGSAQSYLRAGAGKEGRDSISYLRFAADGAFADTLARQAAQEYVIRGTETEIMVRPILFGRDSYLGAGGGRVFVGQSDAFRIEGMDWRGTPLVSIRRAGELRTPGREEVDRVRAASEEAAKGNAGEAAGPREEPLPARPTVPAFDRLLVDQQGHLWVRDFLLVAADAQRWSVFDPQGRRVATVETPAGVDVFQIGPDWILGRGRDELDVEYVRLYRLHRDGDPADG